MCESCGAALSNLSMLKVPKDIPKDLPKGYFDKKKKDEKKELEDGKVWICGIFKLKSKLKFLEFCGHLNTGIDMENEEIPSKNVQDYLLNSPSSSTSASDLIIFCVDISGSMCVTTEMPVGHDLLKIRGIDKKNSGFDGIQVEGSQYLPNQKKNVNYVSRMQCMQAAIDLQLEEILKQHPTKKVVMIAFNDEGQFQLEIMLK